MLETIARKLAGFYHNQLLENQTKQSVRLVKHGWTLNLKDVDDLGGTSLVLNTVMPNFILNIGYIHSLLN